MFFRREKLKEVTFAERLDKLRQEGFTVDNTANGPVRVARKGCAAEIENSTGQKPRVLRTGVLIGPEIGTVVDAGYQKLLVTPSGRREPGLAAQLKALHSFQEDLREALGLTSLYNESLGTVNNNHLYDRVVGRDKGVGRRPWER